MKDLCINKLAVSHVCFFFIALLFVSFLSRATFVNVLSRGLIFASVYKAVIKLRFEFVLCILRKSTCTKIV